MNVHIEGLEVRIEEFEARVQELEARLDQHSQNSSRPPSSDPPRFKCLQRHSSTSGRKTGGQPGHRGHHRIEYSDSEVDEVVALVPSGCEKCGMQLEGAAQDERWWRHQVVELPQVRVKVTEYRFHSHKCPRCGHRVSAQLSSGVPRRPFGPTLQATAAMLTGRYRLSHRETQQPLENLSGSGIDEQCDGASAEAEGFVAQGEFWEPEQSRKPVRGANDHGGG